MNWYFLGSNIQHTKTVPTKIPLNSWCLFPVNKSVWNYLQCLHMSIKKHTLQPKKQQKSSPPIPPLLSFHPLKNPLFLRWSTPSKKKQGLLTQTSLRNQNKHGRTGHDKFGSSSLNKGVQGPGLWTGPLAVALQAGPFSAACCRTALQVDRNHPYP